MKYGVANVARMPDQAETKAMIWLAYNTGVTDFDTAVLYGSAESRLGELFASLGIAGRDVMTKFGQEDLVSPDAAVSATRACLLRLKIPRLSAVYAHAFSACSK